MNRLQLKNNVLLIFGVALCVSTSTAYAEEEGVLGRPYFQELRARAQSAFDELEARMDDEFEGGERRANREEELRAQEATKRAQEAAKRAQLKQAEVARRIEAERSAREAERSAREAERSAREAERSAQEAERSAREAERSARGAERSSEERRRAQARAARVKATEERKAKERAARAGYRAPEATPQRRELAEPGEGRFEARILELVNQERSRGGDCADVHFEPAPPLRANGKLAVAAQRHAEAMERERFFDHRDPRGEGPKERIDEQGYQGRAWGENIAAGQRSPESVMRAWMRSPGHCKNILNPLFNELGVGLVLNAKGPYRTYWVQNFGRSAR